MAEIQMPKGALARERWTKLVERIQSLERRVALLEGDAESKGDGSSNKERIVARAVKLGIGPESTLSRWGEERLKSEIAKAEADDSGDGAEE